MAWEERSGRLYYYRSVRQGGRVVKEYVGAGEAAGLIARLDAHDRRDKERARREERDRREEADALDRRVAELDRLVTEATEQALAAAGYHRHKRGGWRKRRAHESSSSGTGEAG